MNAKQDASSRTPEHQPTRRAFLGTTPVAAAATLGAPILLPRISLARSGGGAASGNRDKLISVYLRGGMDGLTGCVPYGDTELYNARPTLAVQPPGQTDGAIDLDGFFGLAPAASAFLTPWNAGHMAIVHATGSTDPSRSHFSAQRFMETATPNMPTANITTGWLGRWLASSPPIGAGDFRALSLGSILPRTLNGAPSTLPIPDPDNFVFPGDPATIPQRRMSVEAMYDNAQEPLAGAAASSLATIDLLDTIDFANYTPENGAVYEDLPFANGLKSVAAILKAGVGLEAAHLDFQGWDHHSAMGPINGLLATMLGELSRALEAFYLDMLGLIDDTVVVVMSEFGRRIAENGSAGTDHGHGNCMYVIGGHIAGGQVLTQWPGLSNTGNGDLDITIDYRDILAEILEQRLGASPTQLDDVFPNHTRTSWGITV